MRRRIYLLNIALTLALVNLVLLPITAGSLVPAAGDTEPPCDESGEILCDTIPSGSCP
jgi:hypothetical protein